MVSHAVRANLHAAADPARIVEYRRAGTLLNYLPVILGVYALFLWGLVFATAPQAPRGLFWAGFLGLIGLTLLGAWRGRPSAPPELLLAPQGLALRFNGVIAVPWSLIDAIETRSFEGFMFRYRGRNRVRFDDVTMIRVPRGFLQAERDAGRFGTFDPTTDWVIRPAGAGDWIALHHEIYGLTPAEIRGPVEARWRAHAEGRMPQAASPLPPLRLGGFRPARPVGYRLGTAAAASAIVIILANLVGIWETRGQAESRRWAERMTAVTPQEEGWRRDMQRLEDARERMQRMLEDAQRRRSVLPPMADR